MHENAARYYHWLKICGGTCRCVLIEIRPQQVSGQEKQMKKRQSGPDGVLLFLRSVVFAAFWACAADAVLGVLSARAVPAFLVAYVVDAECEACAVRVAGVMPAALLKCVADVTLATLPKCGADVTLASLPKCVVPVVPASLLTDAVSSFRPALLFPA